MFKFNSLLSKEDTKWAKRNMIAEDSKYKMMLTINHWLIGGSVNPEACRKELMQLLSIRAQTSTWAVDLREKQEVWEKQHGNTQVAAELLSEKDYYILARNFDATYMYSEQSSTYDHGEQQSYYLDTIVAKFPHLKDTWGEFAHQISPLGTSKELQDVIAKYNPDLNIGWNKDYSCIDFDTKSYYKAFLQMEKALSEMQAVSNGWKTKPVLMWTKHVPPRTFGLSVPNEWLSKLEEFGDILNEIFVHEYNQRLLSKMFTMRYFQLNCIHIEPVSTSPTEHKVLVQYDSLRFYHDFKFCVNKVLL